MAFCEKSHSLKCAPYSLLSFFFTAQGGNRASSRGGQCQDCAAGGLELRAWLPTARSLARLLPRFSRARQAHRKNGMLRAHLEATWLNMEAWPAEPSGINSLDTSHPRAPVVPNLSSSSGTSCLASRSTLISSPARGLSLAPTKKVWAVPVVAREGAGGWVGWEGCQRAEPGGWRCVVH